MQNDMLGRLRAAACRHIRRTGALGSPAAHKSMEIPEPILMGCGLTASRQGCAGRSKRQTPFLPQAASLLKADLPSVVLKTLDPTIQKAMKIALQKFKQIGPAGRLGRKARLQLQQVSRIILRAHKHYRLWSPEPSKYPFCKTYLPKLRKGKSVRTDSGAAASRW